jgi:hypothetical protein
MDSIDDLFLWFFKAVEAPVWHGRNFMRFVTVSKPDKKEIEAPYRLVFINFCALSGDLRDQTDSFIKVLSDLAKENIAVEIRIENAKQ